MDGERLGKFSGARDRDTASAFSPGCFVPSPPSLSLSLSLSLTWPPLVTRTPRGGLLSVWRGWRDVVSAMRSHSLEYHVAEQEVLDRDAPPSQKVQAWSKPGRTTHERRSTTSAGGHLSKRRDPNPAITSTSKGEIPEPCGPWPRNLGVEDICGELFRPKRLCTSPPSDLRSNKCPAVLPPLHLHRGLLSHAPSILP